VKKSAKDGQTVTIRGRVAGQVEPLAKNRALMTLLDSSVKTCDTIPGDTCKTPWDACCEPADALAAHSATVQVVGTDGRPIKATLAGVGGIQPLKQVVVSGKAKRAEGADALIVEATQIYVTP
jgi:hypothetical protein